MFYCSYVFSMFSGLICNFMYVICINVTIPSTRWGLFLNRRSHKMTYLLLTSLLPPSTSVSLGAPTYLSVSSACNIHCPSKGVIADPVQPPTPKESFDISVSCYFQPCLQSLNHTLFLSRCFIHFSFHYYCYSLIPHHSDTFLQASQTACTRYFTSFPYFGQWQPNSLLCAGLSMFSKFAFQH